MTPKNVLFRWSKECQHAFGELKHGLVTAPILTYHKVYVKFVVETDAIIRGLQCRPSINA